MARNEDLSTITRKRRLVSKNGCRTCKIRKVKCDEGRPACNRCISTGRVCDGYAIRKGCDIDDAQHRGVMAPDSRAKPMALPLALHALTTTASEHHYVDWFLGNTKRKIPGPFVRGFWRTLVIQASYTERSVLDALLTLSAVHRRECCDGYGRLSENGVQDEQERFMLQHYVQATTQMRLHIVLNKPASTRVALISCVLLVSLEFLRGYFGTAQAHLSGGLYLIRGLEFESGPNATNEQDDRQVDSAEQAIHRAVARMQLHVELFRSTFKHDYSLLSGSTLGPHDGVFQSAVQAWDHLEHLLHAILLLKAQNEQLSEPPLKACVTRSEFVQRQQILMVKLSSWIQVLFVSKHKLPMEDFKVCAHEDFVMHYLLSWHGLVTVLAATCLDDENLTVFEAFNDTFSSIVTHCSAMHSSRKQQQRVRALPGRLINMSRSLIDIGWLPPLYFTALRCTVRKTRLEAIELMEANSHREGIWDSKICAKVARVFLDSLESVAEVNVELTDDFGPGVRVLYRFCQRLEWHERWLHIGSGD